MIPKFRGYNPATNYWYDPTEVFVSNGDIYLDDEDFEGFIQNNDVELMQSTGLFDKNGTEIFEGDVIRCTHKVAGNVFEGIVRYDNRYGFWGVIDKRFDDLCAIPSAGAYVGYLSEIVFCEVIGNIYENPELVEGI